MVRHAAPREKAGGACAVSGCNEEAARSIAADKLKKALSGTSLRSDSRRAHVCKKHYREFRKKTKGERELERLGW